VNISDPNRSFTASEWETLGATGRTTVMSLRDRNQGRGGRDGRGGRRVSFRDNADERNVSSTAIVEYHNNADEGSNNEQADNSTISSERGGLRPTRRGSLLTPWATGFSNVTGAAHPHIQMEMSKMHESVSDHIDYIKAPRWTHITDNPRRRQSDYSRPYCKQ
jgi:hypothetical protein